MRIGLDARLNGYRRGGIATYNEQLLEALAALAPDIEWRALQHASQRAPLVESAAVRRVSLHTPPHHRLEASLLPLELLPLRLDVLHCPDFVAPRWRPCRAVVTIHDLAFLHFPEILDDAARRYYSQVRDSVWHADAVIAVSEATRHDISMLLDLPPERVSVIYEAAAPLFRPDPPPPGTTEVINGHAVQAGTFALFVSTLEPRKNLTTLLRALRVCCDRYPTQPYHLVVAGARGWRDQDIFATVRDLRLYDRVTFLGSVPLEDLRWLYNACLFYINPSLYEGFGLPVLEAMACGAPCLVSDSSSLPEITGDAALLVPPRIIDAWISAFLLLWEDIDQRADLSRRGLTQAARFSWQRAASETLTVYQRCLGAV